MGEVRMARCGDFGGVNAKGEPCGRNTGGELCPAHREDAVPGGRPSEYLEEYCGDVLQRVGRDGKSVAWYAKHLEVSRDTVYEWAKAHPEFSDALSRAQEWSEATWEDRIEAMMMSRDVNAPLVKLYLANRFGWSDKQDLDLRTPDGIQVSVTRRVVAATNRVVAALNAPNGTNGAGHS